MTCAIGGETAPVEREDVDDTKVLGKQQQRGVGIVYRRVGLFFHQCCRFPQRVRLGEIENLHTGGGNEAPKSGCRHSARMGRRSTAVYAPSRGLKPPGTAPAMYLHTGRSMTKLKGEDRMTITSLIGKGCSNRHIARLLQVAEGTVKCRVLNRMAALGLPAS